MRFLILPLALLLCTGVLAQDATVLTLPEVVAIARSESPDAKLAETQLNNNLWRFRSFQADFKPQISLDATLPSLNRSIDAIVLPDGSEDFIPRSLMRNSVNVFLSQPIVATGGQVFLRTGLRRLDIFETDISPSSVSYLSTPISLGFNQPLRGFNELKWGRRIEPLRYEENRRRFDEARELAAAQATTRFFDLLIAQLNLEAARQDKINADTLFAISQGRSSVGRIAETDLLQIELSTMNANAALATASLNQQTANEALRSFLGITDDITFDLVPPAGLPAIDPDVDAALDHALRHRAAILGFERRALEAESEVDRAVKQNGFQIDVEGQFGLSGTGRTLGGAYDELIDQEVVTLGLRVPIADFGKARSRIEVARSNQQLELLNIEQERISFERRIRLAVRQFALLRDQVDLADRANIVGQRREQITRDRYLIGKISVTELNLAVQEMDAARRRYVSALRNFWTGYYELRRLTLYDFIRDESLSTEDETGLRR